MSQAGRGLNGGIDYVFNFLLILDYISNGNASFYVNAYGDIICHSIQIATTLTVNTITVLSGLVAPTFSNTSNTFSVDAAGLLLSTWIKASTFSNASETFLADVDGNVIANSLVVYVGSLDINVGNEIVNLQETKADTSWVTNDSTGFFKTVKDWVNANFEPILDLTNIVCQTINTNTSTLSLNNTLTNAVTYIKGRVGINEPNPVVGSVLHVVGSTTIDGGLGVTGSINLIGSPTINVRTEITNLQSTKADTSWVTNDSTGFFKTVKDWANSTFTTYSYSANEYYTRLSGQYLESKVLKGYAKVAYTSGLGYTVVFTWNCTFYFEYATVTGQHVVEVTAVDLQDLCWIQSTQTIGMSAPSVWNVTIATKSGNTTQWSIESYNVGGSRVRASFYVMVF